MSAGAIRRAAVRRWRAARRELSALLVLTLSLTLAGAALAQPPRPAPLEVSVTEVQVGTKGYGLTAGPGNAIERFPVEVVAVVNDGGAGFPLVLIRAGGPFIAASGGVAAGMSGSPVYLATDSGNALLGAIGYVFPNADHDLALVTPIAAMRRTHRAKLPSLLEVAGYGQAVAAATPVLLSGAGPRAAPLLERLFFDGSVAPFPVQGGAAPNVEDTPYRLEPGSAIAVALISGDAQMSAVGTVTTVEGERLLAFGHPFLGLGAVSLPFMPAYVTTIVTSREVPFKLANSGRTPLGVIDQDRPSALSGRLGVTADNIEVTLSVVGLGRQANHSFQVAADERISPTLVALGTLQLLDRYLAATVGGYAEVAWEVNFASGERVNILEQVNDGADIGMAAALLAGSPLALLAENEFRAAPLERLAINVRLSDRQQVASLEEAVAEEEVVRAGDSAVVHLRLQPFRERAVVRTITVPLPEGVSGELTLLIRGGSVPRDSGDDKLDEREIDEPRSFGELLEALQAHVQASELVVEAITEDGDVLRLLRTPFSFVVTGNESVTLTVKAIDAGDEAPEEENGSGDGTKPSAEGSEAGEASNDDGR